MLEARVLVIVGAMGCSAAAPSALSDAGTDATSDQSADVTQGGDASLVDVASDRQVASAATILGWYEGASCTCNAGNGEPGNIDAFGAWLTTPISIGSDYAATDTWANWAFPGWQSTGWQAWRAAHPKNRLVYAPGFGVAQDLAGGAEGNYDAQWKALGQALVAAGYPDAIIRIAHEFNGNWYWYQPQGKEAQFIGYWQHAVTAMRSVAGQSFEFFWNPTLGVSTENGKPFDCENAYPGDAYVDYIGPDTYDDDWGVYPTSGTVTQAMQDQTWQNIVSQDHGLSWFVTFAAAHGKPLAVAEWGLWAIGSGHGGGDDPTYIQRMHDWLDANHVVFADYFDSGDNQIYPSTTFPSSLAKLKQLY